MRSKDAQKQLARTSLIRLIGPFKPYLAETISLQSSNCNILGLAATVPSSLTKPIYSGLGDLPGMFSENMPGRSPKSE